MIVLTVTASCGHSAEFDGKIEEKYPFWCEVCEEDRREGKYPWVVTARTEPDGYQIREQWGPPA